VPSWTDVLGIDYRDWDIDRLVVDTATGDVTRWVRLITEALPAR
jgi:hypothetical protein